MSKIFEWELNGGDLYIEFDRDGEVMSATAYNKTLNDHIDCTERIKTSEYWKEKAQEELAERQKDLETSGEPEETEDRWAI